MRLVGREVCERRGWGGRSAGEALGGGCGTLGGGAAPGGAFAQQGRGYRGTCRAGVNGVGRGFAGNLRTQEPLLRLR